MKKFDSVETYIEGHDTWTEALVILREIMLNTELVEAFKWSAPVYTVNGKNVLGLGAFKHHFCIWFFNGVFLKDEHHLLEQAADTTKGLRQMRFDSATKIDKHAVLAYTLEAIENQKLGKELKPERKTGVTIPEILKDYFKSHPEVKAHFQGLTPSKQREYAEHISSAKRETTKQSRLENILPLIKQGVGLNDKYKNC